MNILLVEDQPSTSLLVQTQLENWGYTVVCAQHGQEAWDIIQAKEYPIVLTDWLMPIMDGLELCRTIRAKPLSNYTYVILGTSKSSQEDLIHSLEAGADDFIAKPYNLGELLIKLRNAERVISYDQTVKAHAKELETTLVRIQEDLRQAAHVQQSLLPKELGSLLNISFDWLFLPSNEIGGDTLNIYQIDDSHLAFYVVDVVGHGIPAAMEAMTINKLLAPTSIKNHRDSVSSIAQELNARYQNSPDVLEHFTMAYGILNTQTYQLRIVHAGHPATLLVKPDGTCQDLKNGGLPIGITEHVEYQDLVIDVQKGDRLYLYSDGVLECVNPQEERFGRGRLQQILQEKQGKPLHIVLATIHSALQTWSSHQTFEDDVTVLGLEIG